MKDPFIKEMLKAGVLFLVSVSLLVFCWCALFGIPGKKSRSERNSGKSSYSRSSDNISGVDKSSYWYDDKKTEKRKADERVKKLKEREENDEQSKEKRTIIVNGKPF